MKKIFIVVMLLLMSGCASEYNLQISNDSFKEDIKIIFNKNDIPSNPYQDEIETDDRVTPFIENKYPAFFSESDNKNYNKKVVYTTDHINVDMSYEYSSTEFSNSNSLNSCIENFDFYDSDTYYIHAYGEFYCLYSDSININIKTNNEVIENNADSVNGNVYTWNINKSNKDNVLIKFNVSKGFPYKAVIKYSVITIVLIGLVSTTVYLLYKKNKQNNMI